MPDFLPLTEQEVREAVDALIAGETTFFALIRRQQKRAESLTNVTPISTPFYDLVK